jgi:hypothetical protein
LEDIWHKITGTPDVEPTPVENPIVHSSPTPETPSPPEVLCGPELHVPEGSSVEGTLRRTLEEKFGYTHADSGGEAHRMVLRFRDAHPDPTGHGYNLVHPGAEIRLSPDGKDIAEFHDNWGQKLSEQAIPPSPSEGLNNILPAETIISETTTTEGFSKEALATAAAVGVGAAGVAAAYYYAKNAPKIASKIEQGILKIKNRKKSKDNVSEVKDDISTKTETKSGEKEAEWTKLMAEATENENKHSKDGSKSFDQRWQDLTKEASREVNLKEGNELSSAKSTEKDKTKELFGFLGFAEDIDRIRQFQEKSEELEKEDSSKEIGILRKELEEKKIAIASTLNSLTEKKNTEFSSSEEKRKQLLVEKKKLKQLVNQRASIESKLAVLEKVPNLKNDINNLITELASRMVTNMFKGRANIKRTNDLKNNGAKEFIKEYTKGEFGKMYRHYSKDKSMRGVIEPKGNMLEWSCRFVGEIMRSRGIKI